MRQSEDDANTHTFLLNPLIRGQFKLHTFNKDNQRTASLCTYQQAKIYDWPLFSLEVSNQISVKIFDEYNQNGVVMREKRDFFFKHNLCLKVEI